MCYTRKPAAEGVARDLVRIVQQARRDAGLEVSDRIRLTVDAPADVLAAACAHEAFIASEALAVQVHYGALRDGAAEGTVGEGVGVRVAVEKAVTPA